MQLGITPAKTDAADIDETPKKAEKPEAYALRLAQDKARMVAARHRSALVLAADTVVCCGTRILPKAEDEKTARTCLALLSGRRHRVITAVAAMHGKMLRTVSVITVVRFKRLSAADINDYIASGEWQGKAGGYAIQGRAAGFIPWIKGSYSNVVGLPLAETKTLIDLLSL